jgi:AcrR family transcriptional regulator
MIKYQAVFHAPCFLADRGIVMDKRSIKSRQMLQSALLELLREEAFENIEIQAITEKADTARVTFYRHYGTKEELLLDVLENIYQDLKIHVPELTIAKILDFQQLPPSYFLFNFLASDRALHKKLLTGSASALIQARIRHYVLQSIMQNFQKDANNADFPISLLANQMASMLIGNIMWWLTEDVPHSPEYMARISHWIIIGGIMTLLGRSSEIHLPPADWLIE